MSETQLPTAQELADQIVAPALGLPSIGADEDFFDHDATSLHLVQIAATVFQQYQVEIPLPDLFDEPTAAALARLLHVELAAAS